MAPAPVSRRSFLALTGGAVLLAACGSKGSTKSSPTVTSVDPNALTTAIMSSDMYASAAPQRVAFIALTEGRKYASRAPATVSVKGPDGSVSKAVEARLYRKGLPTDRGVYVIEPVLAKEGVYTATVKMAGQTIALPFQVQPKPSAPAIGTMAPRDASPTPAKTLGVNPLCTRKPACPLHQVSLSDIIGKGKPVAVMFATPAYCQSQYCGPVLDTLLPFAKQQADRIDFVHVEIYRDSSATNVAPTVAAWNLQSEPWLFGVDGTGKIVARLDGAFGSEEIDALLRQLAPA